MYQRRGKKKPAAFLRDDSDSLSKLSLIRFLDRAIRELQSSGDEDAALRFENFRDYMLNDFRGCYLEYNHRILGL